MWVWVVQHMTAIAGEELLAVWFGGGGSLDHTECTCPFGLLYSHT